MSKANYRRDHKQYDNRVQQKRVVNNRSKQEHALSTSVFEVCAEAKHKLDAWNIDSGCTSHMSPRIDWMKNVRPFEAHVKLAEAGRVIKAEAKGDIPVSILGKNGDWKDVNIKDVLYVPKLRSNLLSVRSMVDKGNKVIFGRNNVKIVGENDEILAETKEVNNMYLLETVPRIISDSMSVVSDLDVNVNYVVQAQSENDSQKGEIKLVKTENATNQELTDKMLWHRRLGHLNEEYLDRLNRKNIVRGMQFKPTKLNQCEECITGKMCQTPYRQIQHQQAEAPLELIHMDLCGPMPEVSLGGARYMYTLVDTYSRRIFTYFLKSKSDAFEIFKEFANMVENELEGRKIKSIRSDNGTEFVNENFENLFRERGIKHQKTVPYSPQSNGIAERANRSILDKTRTMLIDARLPIQFWAEAAATAVYLKNRSPLKNEDVTPMEKWDSRSPTVSFLKVFGCVAYYYIPRNKRTKLDAKAEKGIFLGYSQHRKAYRIYDVNSKQVHEARTVKFNENIRGSILLRDGTTSVDQNGELEYEKLRLQAEEEEEEEVVMAPARNQIDNEVTNVYVSDRNPATEMEENTPRPGRKAGETDAIIQARHLLSLQEREERLRSQGVRRSKRLNPDYCVDLACTLDHSIPDNVNEAMRSENAEEWKQAMQSEMQSLNKHRVWELVPRENGIKVLKSRWVFSKKEDEVGNEKFKARLVAAGYAQRPGIDYENSFAPVMKLESLRLLLALSAQHNFAIKQYDVKTAYLYGDLDQPVYMEQPEGFTQEGPAELVCKLKKSLYGLPQSGYCWNEKINETLSEIGIQRLVTDPCVYRYCEGNEMLLMGIYVDDILVVGSSEALIDKIMQKLKEHFEIKETQGRQSFLGISINCPEPGIIHLGQKQYVEKILKRFHLDGCNIVKSPGDPNQNLDECENSPKVDKTKYQEMLGSLMYLSVGTRPDIAYIVNRLSQYNQDPREIHMSSLKRIYRYLKGTSSYVLTYTKGDIKLEVSADASWCSTSDAKSYSGYTVKLGKSLIAWKSQKQSIVTLSTCESELVSICEGVKEVKWAVSILEELGMVEYLKKPIKVNSDSKSAIEWISKRQTTSRTKHINRKYHFIKDEVKNGSIEMKYVSTREMEADMMTKSLSVDKLTACVKMVNLL